MSEKEQKQVNLLKAMIATTDEVKSLKKLLQRLAVQRPALKHRKKIAGILKISIEELEEHLKNYKRQSKLG